MKSRDVIERLSRRQDSEHDQALLRVIFVGAGLSYFAWLQGFDIEDALYVGGFLSLAFSLSLLFHIIKKPQVNYTRRWIGMAHDVASATLLFSHGGELASLFLFVYPFMAIGNGFRYGEKWLLGSALMGAIGLATLLAFSPYWRELPIVSAGLALNFIIVVGYTGLLLRKLRSTTRKLEELATHDALTGLPNRRLIMDQLRHTLEFNLENRKTVACVYFDLDGFKRVNDTLGHGAGDFLLQEVGRRTRSLLRDQDLLARLGGDEFSIVIDSVQSREDAEVICRRVVKAVEDITEIMGHPVAVSVSVGCVLVSPFTTTVAKSEEEVMRLADQCMYQSKKSGAGRYTIAETDESESASSSDAA